MTQSEMLGNISDLCIWSRALGEHEIAEIYTRGLNLSPFYYLFQKSGVWIVIISGIVLSIVIFYFFRKYKKVKTASIEPNEGTLEGKMDKTDIKLASRNSIRLFGDFEVLDKDGHSITSLFTPKLKHLFLIILLHSQDDTKGITTQELSEILWKDHDQNSRNNVRRVAILKLRTILNGMDKADILNQSGLLSVLFSANIRCDYLEALRMLRENKTHDIPFYQNFCNVVSSGELLKGESFDWLDDYKGFISNSIVDILLNYLNEINPDKDPDQILRIAGLVLANDPLSEEGLSYKMKALIRQNSHNSAQYAYDRFCSLYSETYGVSYPRTFQDVLS
jgi:two-component SAPR family response regulator